MGISQKEETLANNEWKDSHVSNQTNVTMTMGSTFCLSAGQKNFFRTDNIQY